MTIVQWFTFVSAAEPCFQIKFYVGLLIHKTGRSGTSLEWKGSEEPLASYPTSSPISPPSSPRIFSVGPWGFPEQFENC